MGDDDDRPARDPDPDPDPDSGVGRRHGREGILKCTESQTVAVQRGLPVGPVPGLPVERYATVMTAGPRALKRMPFRR
ncbi:hypothetical protein ACI8AG_13540 [Blastococcus sp. SYSU DS0552]